MYRLGPNGQRWLKCLHVLAAGVWVGTAMALSVQMFFIQPYHGAELYGILSTLDFIDLHVLVPGAIGTLLTGLVYSLWTHWGWFKHRWVTVKWVICLYGVCFGTYPLGPWLSGLARIAREKGLAAFADPVFLSDRTLMLVFGPFQAATLILAFYLSFFRPWKSDSRGERNGVSRAHQEP
jgi:hypothetical protein